MWFWLFIFICDLLTPAVMILGGYFMWKRSPKDINGLVGYRTSRSMKNSDTWKFAQEYCGHLWWKIGWILLAPSVLVHIPVYGASENSIGTVSGILITIQMIVLVVSIFPTERILKKTFTDDGKRR